MSKNIDILSRTWHLSAATTELIVDQIVIEHARSMKLYGYDLPELIAFHNFEPTNFEFLERMQELFNKSVLILGIVCDCPLICADFIDGENRDFVLHFALARGSVKVIKAIPGIQTERLGGATLGCLKLCKNAKRKAKIIKLFARYAVNRTNT